MEREEIKWKQKSRELWLKKGDRNSKFFHLSTLIRRHTNFIAEIQLANGNWIHSRKDIEGYFASEFQYIFQSFHPQIPPLLEGFVSPCISNLENEEISKIPKPSEIREVIWVMHSLKASGPDGFPSLFFKNHWDIVCPQVTASIQSFFRDRNLLPCINHTFITLISKKQGACNFNHFRPISLCNFFYKIISKILANRMRPLLAKIIDSAQAAFVP